MGSVLDSTIIISAERAKLSAEQLMERISGSIRDQSVVLSAIGYTEILHGFYRDQDALRREKRAVFFSDFLRKIPIYPYTSDIAQLAGRIGGEQAALGLTIPSSDLMIGATALHLGYSILTGNVRHMALIPGLDVIPF
jgi:predicted nucleic acid-binding protein